MPPAEYGGVRGGPRSRPWDCCRCRRPLSPERSGTVRDSHSGDKGQSKVWGNDEGAFGKGRLSRDNEAHRSSSCSGMGDSSMSIGGRDCVEVGNVGGGDIGASQAIDSFFITKVESRTRLMQGCGPGSDVV